LYLPLVRPESVQLVVAVALAAEPGQFPPTVPPARVT
jgi:hypothetical protein